jgi:hypothetical protein
MGLTTPHSKNFSRYEMFHRALGQNDSLAQHKQWKNDMRFGTLNVRSRYRVGAIKSVVGKLERYKLDLVGIQEVKN